MQAPTGILFPCFAPTPCLLRCRLNGTLHGVGPVRRIQFMMRSQKSEESNCLEELNSIREGRALIGLGSSYLGSNQEVQWLCVLHAIAYAVSEKETGCMDHGGIVKVREGRNWLCREMGGEGRQRIPPLRPKKRGAQFRATKVFRDPTQCFVCNVRTRFAIPKSRKQRQITDISPFMGLSLVHGQGGLPRFRCLLRRMLHKQSATN